jgi:DNA-binding transcriptional LysR family regulator
MSIIHVMDAIRQLARLDLNLLVALGALLEELHVTNAGRRVGLSQPAMSNALGRLRRQLGDPLLVRTPGGMVPTPRATELAGPVRDALAAVEAALAAPGPFDPTAPRRFVLAVTDYAGCVLLPALATDLAQNASGIDLDVRPFEEATRDDLLRRGEIDVAIEYIAHLGEGFRRQTLLEEDFRCVVRGDHPGVGKRLTLKRYVALPHLLVSPRGGGGRGIVDEMLAAKGLERRIAMNIPHFMVAPLLVARSDMIATLPRRIAEEVAPRYGLRVFRPPLAITGFALDAVWHARTDADPGRRWLVERMRAVA